MIPGHRKIHAQPIALAGGLAVLAGFFVPLLLRRSCRRLPAVAPVGNRPQSHWIELIFGRHGVGLLGYGFFRRGSELAAILLGAVGMGLLGWLDDKYRTASRPASLPAKS